MSETVAWKRAFAACGTIARRLFGEQLWSHAATKLLLATVSKWFYT
jgi:hypothetical protein